MGPQKESFAQRVLDKVVSLADATGEVGVADLAEALLIQTAKQHKRMLNALSDLSKSGRVARVRQGFYAPAERERPQEKREVMWRVLRMRKRVNAEDLMEMAGVSEKYAKDWLLMLVKRGVVRKIGQGDITKPHVWQLINDTVEMPTSDDEAARLRELRRKKKQQALEYLNKAYQAIENMEED